MSKYPSLPLWVDAWAADTDHLSNIEIGIYIRLLVLMWRSPNCRIPNDDSWISRHLKTPIEPVRAIIDEFCKNDGNWLTQKRLVHEHDFVASTRQAQSDRAKAKWRKQKIDATCGIDPAYAPTPTPTPTNIKRERDARAREDGTLVPDDLEFNSAQIAYADQHGLGLDLGEILSGFKNWHKDRGWKSHDWNARLWIWLKRAAAEQHDGKLNGGKNGKKSGTWDDAAWQESINRHYAKANDGGLRGSSAESLQKKRPDRSD